MLDVRERWTRVRPRRRIGAKPAVNPDPARTHNPIRPISAPSPFTRCGTDHNRRIRETTDGRYLDLPKPAVRYRQGFWRAAVRRPTRTRRSAARRARRKVLFLESDEREVILIALDDPPQGLDEMGAVLLQEHVWRQREGL